MEIINLIWACAWCPKNTWKPLKKGQNYTHGICPKDKKRVLKEYQNSHKKYLLTFPS